MSEITPPKWSRRILRLIIHGEYLEEIEGDLEEVFYDDLEFTSIQKARRRYTLGVLNLFRLNLIKNLKWIYKIGLIVKIMRTFKLAFRNLIKFRTHSAINLVGLSLGLAVGGLILLYVIDELSFDNFHAKGDRIYKVVTSSEEGGMETNGWPLGYKLRTEFPEVESVLYAKNFPSNFKFVHDNKRHDKKIFYASQEFFDLFSFDVSSSNLDEALTAPFTAVINESLADVYFEGDALGKTLTLADSLKFEITGVVKNLPKNSHIQFDILVSFPTIEKIQWWSYTDGWGNFNVINYILLKEGIDKDGFEAKALNIYDENIGDWLDEMGVSFTTKLIPLNEVYLGEFWNGLGPKGSKKRVKTVTWIATFLLILACINYINLSTARSAFRAKEVGMKKVAGSSRRAIVGQFMTESFLLTVIAFIVGFFIIGSILPFFNDLMDKQYSLASFGTWEFVFGIAILSALVTVGSGFYPAWVISSLNPLNALSGKLDKTYQGLSLRKILITFQFFISSGLVISTLLVINQINYMRNQELGFENEN